jgi:hypothetical protein
MNRPTCFRGLLLASVSAVLALLGAITSADEAAVPLQFSAPKADRALVIDGVLCEPCWQAAAGVPLVHPRNRKGERLPESACIMKVAWDDQYLYIGYDFSDSNLLAEAQEADPQGPYNNKRRPAVIDPGGEADFVEFFISLGDTNFFWEIHHNANNDFSDVWCVVPSRDWPLFDSTMHMWGIYFGHQEYIRDDGPYEVAMAVRLKPNAGGRRTTLNGPGEDGGCTAEIRLPWLGLGASRKLQTWAKPFPDQPRFRIRGPWKMAGQKLKILGVMHNGDLPEMYYTSSPTLNASWFHMTAPDWPVFTLVE